MKRTISEMAKLSGVSVRTLHYYDEIELLTPSEVIPETGYRYYDDDALVKLQQILFYRELDFPLREIVQIMSASNFNKEKALLKQRELLKLKRKRLDQLIKLLNANLKGDTTMRFEEFNTDEIEAAKEKFSTEVKEKWGNTEAYEENLQKTAGYGKENWKKVTEQMDDLLKKFAAHLEDDPASESVQKLVGEWQQYITDAHYNCTKEILADLGTMYTADERFTKNMDKFGVGTGKLMSDAIAVYCEK